MNCSYACFEQVLTRVQAAGLPARERLVMARNSEFERASEMAGEGSVNYKLVVKEEREVMWARLGL